MYHSVCAYIPAFYAYYVCIHVCAYFEPCIGHVGEFKGVVYAIRRRANANEQVSTRMLTINDFLCVHCIC